MAKETIEILLLIRDKITDDSDLTWTSFETAGELRKEIDGFISRLDQEDTEVLSAIYVHFLPTSTFQEHSLQNKWADEYMKLAERFDEIYERYK